MLLHDIRTMKVNDAILKKFGLTLGIAAFIAGSLLATFRHDQYWIVTIIGLLLVTVGIVQPHVLEILYRPWMTLSLVLGWLVTRFILITIFYGILTPIAVLAKLSGKQFLDTRINHSTITYWHSMKGYTPSKENYEKQY